MNESLTGGDFRSLPHAAARSRWLIQLFIVVLLCLLGVTLFTVTVTLLTPSILNQFAEPIAASMCQSENPDLSAGDCSRWAGDLRELHLDAIEACQFVSTDGRGDGPSEFYYCLIDEGVPPPQ
jgi:hypothetical protein